MKTITHNFKTENFTHFDHIQLEAIVYEKGDDGLLINGKALVEGRYVEKYFSIDFSEWNIVLGRVEDISVSEHLQEVCADHISEMPNDIVHIDISDHFNDVVILTHKSEDHQLYELCA